MTRLQQILSIVLVAQIVLAAILLWPRGTTEAGATLLADFDLEAVESVTIEDNSGNRITLARSGDGWVLSSGGDYPANGTTVESLLDKVAAINTGRLATRTSNSHDRLQIADDNFVARVRFGLGGDAARTLYVGSSPNPRSTHVRLAGQDETFLTGELSRGDVGTSAGTWIDTTYITLPRDQIVALNLENGNGAFDLQKTGEDEWVLAGLTEEEAFDDTKVNTLLSRIANMRLAEPLGTDEIPAFGPSELQAVLRVTTEDEEGNRANYTLRVGAFEPEANQYSVKWSESDYFVKVSAFNAEEFVTTTRDDFIAEPEPAEDGGSGE